MVVREFRISHLSLIQSKRKVALVKVSEMTPSAFPSVTDGPDPILRLHSFPVSLLDAFFCTYKINVYHSPTFILSLFTSISFLQKRIG